MTELETAMAYIIEVFDKYCSSDSTKQTLTKAEMKTLMETELPGILGNAKDKNSCDELLRDLDENGDSSVDFKEFIIFVAVLTIMGHERFENMARN